MPASPYLSSGDPPDPVVAFETNIAVGVAPFEITSFQASLLREGSARMEGNFTPFTADASDLILMRPGTRCAAVSLAPVTISIVRVDPTFLVDQVRWAKPSQSRGRRDTYRVLCARAWQPIKVRLDDQTCLDVAELFAQLMFLSRRSVRLGRMIVRATELIWTIESLLTSAQKCLSRERRFAESVAPSERQEVVAVLHAIHERYASDLSIAELAREVALSESALRRAVLASTGFSPREYLHRVRLARFEELVAETDTPLAEAGRMVGWASASHARTMFARSHGMSPREFRAEAQAARRADWRRRLGAELDAPPEFDYSVR